MSAIVGESEKLRELDARTRRAWSAYSRRLRNLSGDEYEAAEAEFWDELQAELRLLDRRRRTVKPK